jgi:hypothetical protein
MPGRPTEDQFVPFRNNVRNRASSIRLAERHTTVHASRRLVLKLILVKTSRKLSPITDSSLGATVLLSTPLVLHEALGLVENESRALLLSGTVLDALFDVEKVALLVLLLLVVVAVVAVGLRLFAGRSAGDDGKGVGGLLGVSGLLGLLFDDTLVVGRQDLDEAGQSAVEVKQDASGELRAGVVVVVLDQTTEESDLVGVFNAAKLNHLLVDLALEVLVDVKDVGDPTRHTSSEVTASAAKAKDATTSHVLATVVTHTLNNCGDTRVTNSETLGCDTTEETSTSGSAVQANVADYHVLLGLEDRGTWRVDDEAAAGETLSNIIVAVTLELEGDTRRKEGTERLASGATNVGVDGILWQTLLTEPLADLVGKRSAKSTVSVDDIALDAAWQTLLESQLRLRDELVVKTNVKLVVLLANVVGSNAGAEGVSRGKDQRQVDVLGLCVPQILADLEHLGVANHLVDGPVAKLGHDSTQLVGDVVEKVDDVLWSTLKLLAKLGILCGDTNRARVQMALAHHNAPHSNKRRGSKAPLLSTKQTSNSNIPTRTNLAISLDNHTATEIVKDKRLVSLSKTQLPGETGILDTSPAGSTGTTIMTRDQNVVGPGLSDTRSDDTDTSLGDEFDGDARARVGALQVVDELL